MNRKDSYDLLLFEPNLEMLLVKGLSGIRNLSASCQYHLLFVYTHLSPSLDLINVKDGNNFCISVLKP